MKTFCDDVVTDIKSAKNEGEVIKAIRYAMSRLRSDRNANHEFSYITNMIAALRSVDVAVISVETQNNIKLAIAISRQFNKEHLQRIS